MMAPRASLSGPAAQPLWPTQKVTASATEASVRW
jgi:hypothetical protein